MSHSSGSKRAHRSGKVRIIAGVWRSRQLRVAEIPGLRPTGDRAREMVFNWLQLHLAGARCLDLFAGTGAMGFEAASRGAVEVVLVEPHPAAVAALRQACAELRADQVTVQAETAEDCLLRLGAAIARGERLPFDIVFVDPPFAEQRQGAILSALRQRDILSENGRVCVEAPADWAVDGYIGDRWRVHRERRLGQVRHLILLTSLTRTVGLHDESN